MIFKIVRSMLKHECRVSWNRRQKMIQRTVVPLLVAIALLSPQACSLVSAQSDGIYEAQLFAGNTFNGSGLCGGGANLSYTDDNARMIRDHLRNYGYTSLNIQYDSDIGPDDFVDFTRSNFQGRDHWWPSGADMADIAFYSGHGISSCGAGGFMSKILMVNPWINKNIFVNGAWTVDYSNWTLGSCLVNTNNQMLYGNSTGDLDVVILDACQTVQRCVFDATGYQNMAGFQMSTLLGFHGNSWDMANQWRYDDYGAYSVNYGIGSNWVDALTDLKLFSDDQCATAVVSGDTQAHRDGMYNDGGFKDLQNTGPHVGASFYYWCGCQPDGGPKLGC